jgi:hypothetical protein
MRPQVQPVSNSMVRVPWSHACPQAEQAAAGGGGSLLADPQTNLLSSAQQQEADLLDLGDDDFASPAPLSAAAGGGGGGGRAASGLSLLDDGLGGLEALLGPPAPAAAGTSNGSGGSGLALSPGFKLMPGVFQERWRGLAPCEQYVESLNMASLAALAANGHKDFCTQMGQAHIATMASGGQPPMYK